MKFTLRQMEVFSTLCHTENISRAAEQLAMSQSAASSALKELEQQYNTQLFDRIGKRVQINENGRLLRPAVEALLEQAQGIQAQLEGNTASRSIKVGATLTIGNYLAVGIMAKMMQEDSDSTIALTVANTSDIAAKVLNFELDIGMIEGEVQHPDLDVIEWCDDHLVVFCSPSHPFATLGTLNDQQLLQCDWILRETGSGTRQAFDRAMQGVLPQLKIAHELQHTEAIKRAVEANLGVGCLSKVTVEEAFKHGTLIPLSISNRDLSRKFYFVVHKKKYRGAGIDQWVSRCLMTTGQQV